MLVTWLRSDGSDDICSCLEPARQIKEHLICINFPLFRLKVYLLVGRYVPWFACQVNSVWIAEYCFVQLLIPIIVDFIFSLSFYMLAGRERICVCVCERPYDLSVISKYTFLFYPYWMALQWILYENLIW